MTAWGMFRIERNHDYTLNYPATETDPAVELHIGANITGVQDALRKIAIEVWGKSEVAKAAVRNAAILTQMVEQAPVSEATLSQHPAVKYLMQVPGYKKDAAAAIGTAVHGHAETLNRGGRPDVSDDVLPLVTNYFRGFVQKHRPQLHPDWIEYMVASVKYEYAGTGDLICRIGGDIWALDIKTSSKVIDPSKWGFPYSDTAMQLAACRWAEFMGKPNDPKRYPIPDVTRFGVVAVTPDECELVEYDVTPEDFRAFLAARKVWEWSKYRKDAVKLGIVPGVKEEAA